MSGPTAPRLALVALAATLLLAVPTLRGNETTPANDDRAFLRGMTVSCPGIGRIWGSPAMSQALGELDELGVRWIAIHPYAGVRRDGSLRFEPAMESGYLADAVARVRRAGMELFWKPHLAYWGSFGWRGEIEFGDDEDAWRRFFDQYRAFIVDQARFAETAGIPLFAVGVELDATVHRAAEWRRIVDEVRAVYSGRLTYAANWSEIDRTSFWDRLDLIGVQAYFPLSQAERPTRAELDAAWSEHLARLAALSERHGGRGVLLTEIGYDLSPDAAREPWRRAGRDTAETRALRRLLFEVALERLEREPLIRGLFWWKWIPGERHAPLDFSMRDREARDVLRRAWRSSAASGGSDRGGSGG